MTGDFARRLRRRGALICGLAALSACASGSHLVDLTHAFDADTIYWPTEEGFVHEKGFAGETEGGYYYEAHRFRGAEHGGTHVDAPAHFHAGGEPLDAISLAQLIAPGVTIDVSEACSLDRDHRVSVSELLAWEERNGRIPAGSIVLLHTGFGAYWPDRLRYMGTAKRGAEGVAELHFPGLAAPAARWLARERAIAAVGLDTASIDHGPSQGFEAHRELGAHGVPAFENVANLDRLPARGFEVMALPMKIRGGSGGPLRIVARVPGR